MGDRISELKAENEAVRRDHEELQKEIQDLQGKLKNATALEETCGPMNKVTETINQRNDAMRKEILQLKEKHQHVHES